MTGLLASVASADEAETACTGGADVVDFKDPVHGALGALPLDIIRDGVARVAGRALTSATIGNLGSGDPFKIARAVENTAATGVDFVKIGLFPGGDVLGLLRRLAPLTDRARLIAVLFADLNPDLGLLQAIADADFEGVMLDTATKSGGGLLSVQSLDQIDLFVATAQTLGLTTGLAGQLHLEDIETLLPIEPDYLGFRTALCRDGVRGFALEAERLHALRALLFDAEDATPVT